MKKSWMKGVDPLISSSEESWSISVFVEHPMEEIVWKDGAGFGKKNGVGKGSRIVGVGNGGRKELEEDPSLQQSSRGGYEVASRQPPTVGPV